MFRSFDFFSIKILQVDCEFVEGFVPRYIMLYTVYTRTSFGIQLSAFALGNFFCCSSCVCNSQLSPVLDLGKRD